MQKKRKVTKRNKISRSQFEAARALLGWTQQDAASRAEISVRALQYFERGQVNPNPSTVNALLQAYKTGGIKFTKNGVSIFEAQASAAP